MSKKSGFQLNPAGVRELLQSPAMVEGLQSIASGIQSRAGNGFEQDTFVGQNRANAMVWAETWSAKRRNSRENTLLKALK